MRAAVCQLRNDPAGLEQDRPAPVEHVKAANSDLVLLPEMAFHLRFGLKLLAQMPKS